MDRRIGDEYYWRVLNNSGGGVAQLGEFIITIICTNDYQIFIHRTAQQLWGVSKDLYIVRICTCYI